MAISSNVDQLFALGVQFHGEGNLPQALQAYEQVLLLDPQHFDALHNTGIAAFQSGNFEAAASFIRSALALNPDHAAAHNNLGNALREMQLMEDALRSYDQALALNADDANTHFNRAVTLQSLRRAEDALQGYERVLDIDAADDQAWTNRATLLWQAGQHELALTNVEQALALNPQNIEAHHQRGNVLQDMAQADEAEQSYRQALALFGDYSDAHYNLGRLLLSAGRHAEALQSLDQAILRNPQLVAAHRQRALALQALQRPGEASDAEATALAQQRELIAAYTRRGAELEQKLHYESAAAMYAAALELDGDDAQLQQLHAHALTNTRQNEQIARSLQHALNLKLERAALRGDTETPHAKDLQRKYESARLAFEKLTKLAPHNTRAYINLGTILQALGLRDQAIANYERALSYHPKLAAAHWNLSLLYLARGDYERGWAGYEWRWQFKDLPLYKFKRHFLKPQWTGRESLKGKTILLHAEQGFGDAIQFCRYAKMVKERGAKVVLDVWPGLVSLLKDVAGIDQVAARFSDLPAFDYHIPLLSLPFVFNTRVDTIPAAPSYLRSDPDKRAKWEALLGAKNRLRVGVVWSGSGGHGNDHNRSLPLPLLAPLLTEQFEFICLQKEIRKEDQALLDTLPVRQVAQQLNDFSDTAALAELMDVIITVDTSVAHLAGALGKPVWIMLPTPFEWRWLEHGDTSPWYPSARLYRQEEIGDWTPVIAGIARDLQQQPGATPSGRLQLHTS